MPPQKPIMPKYRPIYDPSKISLNTLPSWTVLSVLEEAHKAGYPGDPSKPILHYRKALFEKIKLYEGSGDAVLANAQAALDASSYDQALISFVFRTMGGGEDSDSAPAPSVGGSSRSSGRGSTVGSRSRDGGASSSAYQQPAPYNSQRRPIVKGFIKKTVPAGAGSVSVSKKRKKQDEEVEEEEGEDFFEEEERRSVKGKKRGGWYYG